jgi:flagellar biosynthesis anti-sigma factor FlgM
MRINPDHGAQLAESSRSNTPNSAAANAPASNANPLGQDHAQLSSTGAQVAALKAQVWQLPEVRQERVQALRQAVQSGNYALNPQAVAGSILDHIALQPAA